MTQKMFWLSVDDIAQAIAGTWGKPELCKEQAERVLTLISTTQAERVLKQIECKPPEGSNADEWHLYLQENQDALPMVACAIAEAIERRKLETN